MTIEFMNVIGFVKFIPFVGTGVVVGLIGGIFTTFLKNQIFYNGDLSSATISPYTGPFWAACTVGGAFTGGYLALT